jgi:hypothetical protein
MGRYSRALTVFREALRYYLDLPQSAPKEYRIGLRIPLGNLCETMTKLRKGLETEPIIFEAWRFLDKNRDEGKLSD